VAAGLLGPAASEVSEVELAIRENAAKIEDYSSRLSQIDGRLQSIDTRRDALAKLILDASLARRNEIAQIRRSIDLDAFQVRQDGSIRSQNAGTVAEVVAAVGQVVAAGGRILTLDLDTREIGLVSVSYFPVRDGKRIRPGMSMQVTPDPVQRARFGGILATVTSVSAAPVTKEGATATIGNAEVVQSLMPDGGYIEVRARLEADASTPSGYRWSSSRGPDTPITEGLTHSTRVTIEGRAPVTYLMPVLREASQIY
jgi:HlyD family secretion protein